MTTLMSGDDMPMGRVLPKVFADVPSAEELKQAHETARRARARAAGLMLVSVLLAGALLAAITFISINSSPSGDLVTERDNALKEVTRLKGEETRLTGEVTRAQTAAEAIRTQFAVYSPVANLEAAISSRRDEVRKLIDHKDTPDTWKGAILIAAHTGLRLGDVIRLNRSHVEGSRLVIRPEKTKRTRKTL
jgi:integrase